MRLAQRIAERHSNPIVSSFFTEVVEKANIELANLPPPHPETTAAVMREDDGRHAEELEPSCFHHGPCKVTRNAAEQSTPDRIETTECQ